MIRWILRVAVILLLISAGYIYFMLSSIVDAKFFVKDDVFVEFKGARLYNVTIGRLSSAKINKGEEFEVFDPVAKHRVKYRGVRFKDLANGYYSNEWERYDGFYFEAVDGYKRFIPMNFFKKFEAYLAYEIPGKKDFSIKSKYRNKNISLGPFYLVWRDTDDPEISVQKGQIWPYQIRSVRPVEFDEVYGALFVSGLSPSASQGAKLFAKYCVACHMVNNVGGKMARNLSDPKVSSYREREWLREWLYRPKSIQPNVSMPPAAYGLEESERRDIIEKIIDYLMQL